ncbi:MAG: transglutaminase family protein [Jatrophihabitantaceae bacterium]
MAPDSISSPPARRLVSSFFEIEVLSRSRLMFQVAVADPAPGAVTETLALTVDGAPLTAAEVSAAHGGRIHTVTADPGLLVLDYRAELTGRAAAPPVRELEEISYLRPSRYAEADRLGPIARAEFAGIGGPDLLAAVSSWVGTRLLYVSGSSAPTDGAVDTLLQGQGVCRDFAHLVVALLRALDVPARLAAVYAPGLSPMDFHAVAEALIEGSWRVVDATLLAPRTSLVRIATGRDAADTAFLSAYDGQIILRQLQVSAIVEGSLPVEDVTALVQLG